MLRDYKDFLDDRVDGVAQPGINRRICSVKKHRRIGMLFVSWEQPLSHTVRKNNGQHILGSHMRRPWKRSENVHRGLLQVTGVYKYI